MININEHIGALLIEHDCVIVKGLGAFVASRVSAMVDKTRGVILPPRKEVVFNRSLLHNDGMLVGYISNQEGITIDEASGLVDEYVTKVKKQLQINGRYDIEGVGVLRRMGSDLIFVEDKSNALLADSYGFAPVKLEEQKLSVRQVMQSKEVRRFASTAAVLACLLLVSPDIRDGEIDSRMVVRSGYSDLFETSTAGVVKEGEAGIEAMDDAVSEDKEEIEGETKVVEPKSKYYIVVGSFAGHKDADKYIADMRRKGIDGLTKVLTDAKRVRVVAGEFANHDDAREKNRQLRRLGGFEKAWVLTVNE